MHLRWLNWDCAAVWVIRLSQQLVTKKESEAQDTLASSEEILKHESA